MRKDKEERLNRIWNDELDKKDGKEKKKKGIKGTKEKKEIKNRFGDRRNNEAAKRKK